MNTTASGPHPTDDLAAYAVGALRPHEHRAVDAHLVTCPRCRTELTGYLETLAALIPDEEPPPEVWARIRDITATTAQALPTDRTAMTAQALPTDSTATTAPAPPTDPTGPADDLPPARPRPTARRWPLARKRPTAPRRRYVPRAAVVGLAAAIIAVALVAGVAALRAIRADPPTATELAQDALEDIDSTVVELDDPDTGAPAARMVVASSGAAYVLFDHLDTLPSGQAYQLWRTEGTTPISLGVLGRGSPDVVQVSLPTGTARLAISREPARGSSTPTGPLVAAGTLPS